MTVQQAKSDAVALALGILSGEIDLIEGCRRIQSPRRHLDARMDEEFRVFVGVDSEADQFVLGEAQREWPAEVLRRQNAGVEEFLEHYRGYVVTACQAVIRRYGSTQ